MKELPIILKTLHDSPQSGGHMGRDSMISSIGKIKKGEEEREGGRERRRREREEKEKRGKGEEERGEREGGERRNRKKRGYTCIINNFISSIPPFSYFTSSPHPSPSLIKNILIYI